MTKIYFLAVVVLALTAAVSAQTSDRASSVKSPAQSPTSNQLLMRDKLTYANEALDGLATEDFAKVAKSGEMLRMISRAASWHVVNSEEYSHLSKNFQEQAADLVRHAHDKNLDASALDYMRMSLTCIQCHKYLRDVRKKTP
jgi:hypothetical protein